MTIDCLSLSWGAVASRGGGAVASGLSSYNFGTVKTRVRSCGNDIYYCSEVCTESIDALMTELLNAVNAGDSSTSSSLLPAKAADRLPHRVTLYIDSPGGIIKDCFKFIDFVNVLRGDGRLHLTTVIVGMAASAATLMACIGDVRYISPLASAMVHELFSSNYGTFTQITSGITRLTNMHESIIGIYLQHNQKIMREKLVDMLMRETWFTAEEYVEAGFVDAVIGGKAPAAGVPSGEASNDSETTPVDKDARKLVNKAATSSSPSHPAEQVVAALVKYFEKASV
jgi:ATP-dependent protease ClpP protease subunit